MTDSVAKDRCRVNVLLVEDNPADVLLLEDALGGVPGVEFSIRVAGRLAQAIEILAAAEFDVAIVDLGLPDSKGLETFEKFQAQSPDLPVLVLTALGDEAIGTRAVRLGAQDFLLKSELRHSLLGRFIRFAIERHRLQRSLRAIREKERDKRECQSMERLSHTGVTAITAGIYSGEPLSESAGAEFRKMVASYSSALDLALEERAHGGDFGRAEALRQLGIELGFLRASPRDVIDIHTTAVKPKTFKTPWKKAQAYREEGRLTALELMGNLAGYYRSLTNGLIYKESANE